MSRRLYLFDIDGTLIATGGAGGAAMRAAFEAVWGLADGFRGVEFSGRTDRAILRAALVAAGLANGAPSTGSGQAFADDLRRFKRAYFRRLPHSLRAATQGRVLPGVEALLGRLAAGRRGGGGAWRGGGRRGHRHRLGGRPRRGRRRHRPADAGVGDRCYS